MGRSPSFDHLKPGRVIIQLLILITALMFPGAVTPHPPEVMPFPIDDINDVFENTSFVFTGTVTRIDSIFVRVQPMEIFKMDDPLRVDLELTVSYREVSRSSKDGSITEHLYYENPFLVGFEYLFFVTNDRIRCYGLAENGLFLPAMLQWPNRTILPGLITKDDWSRILVGLPPLDVSSWKWWPSYHHPAI
jgi:hypothetical protein